MGQDAKHVPQGPPAKGSDPGKDPAVARVVQTIKNGTAR